MTLLHLFDLDGTLMYGSAAPVEISRQLGVSTEIGELERAFAARELTPQEFSIAAHALWAELTPAHVRAAFEGAPWLSGIREVWREIHARGDYCAVISLSPSFFVELLLEWGAHAAHGSVYPTVPFTGPLDVAGILTPEGKVDVADRLCARFGVTRADCVAYGDSLTDSVLFEAVPKSVAVNARPYLAERATYVYEGRDLREAYQLLGLARPEVETS
ncbi:MULTISPECIES: HAD family phosphatase [unclassified Streptomyces]|uniref:HAD family hydrolase n=1 Tax=unclassified Streptomyces TaxID=2593676 RepID=UPI00224FA3E7|nr:MULTISPECIES: haloacid dehalogenase-like hydrolase [unclassified Streptomyces]MCX4526819.1 haloacid dehalogenase-like hydrolase [Streptomyces sp. NBC_01551]MCX4542620.1 haloacid dehalogenase-like hydrolase [Streptomyces sp. NBC_01565]